MGAITLVGHLLPQGARIVAPHDCYGGTFRLFTAWNKRGELKVDFVRFRAMRPRSMPRWRSRPPWCGSKRPSNPLLRITDIEARGEAGHAQRRAGGGRQHLPVAGLAAAARAGRRHRGALDHQVHQRPQRRGRWRGRSRARRSCTSSVAWWANCLGAHGGRLRQLPDAARPAHAACAPGRAWPQCAAAGRVAGEAARRAQGVLPGAAHASGP